MSYLRGNYYVYSDGVNIQYLPDVMPLDVFDALVVMRYSELSEKEIKKAEKKALELSYGNVGCDIIAKKHNLPTICDVLEDIEKKIKKENKLKEGKAKHNQINKVKKIQTEKSKLKNERKTNEKTKKRKTKKRRNRNRI